MVFRKSMKVHHNLNIWTRQQEFMDKLSIWQKLNSYEVPWDCVGPNTFGATAHQVWYDAFLIKTKISFCNVYLRQLTKTLEARNNPQWLAQGCWFITVTYVHTHTPERLCQHVANLADVTENLSNTASKQKRPAIQVSLCSSWGCGAVKHPSPASIPVFTHPCQPPRSGETLACVLWRLEVI